MEPSTTTQEQPAAVLQPRKFDILCGKGKKCVAHIGSRRFRAVIESYRQRYSLTKTKYEKMMITKEVVERLQKENCRFLKYDASTMVWEELPTMAARDKVGHALRFANRTTPRRQKNLSKLEGDTSIDSWESLEEDSSSSSSSDEEAAPKDSGLPTLDKPSLNILEENQFAPFFSVTPVDTHTSTSLVWSHEVQPNTTLQSIPLTETPGTAMLSLTAPSPVPTTIAGFPQDRFAGQEGTPVSQPKRDASAVVQQVSLGQRTQHVCVSPELLPALANECALPLLQEPIVDWDLDFEISPAIFAS
ncbi:expressed unknown protein [Seminavis robusta]|uniref:DUF6824 domain-containing protein n=1 Tax=Seminavis robusta TaxID=568900 RepID=A0A9N8EWS7_9STRA|nr:expressed unknown protein [Seminavis robusta]|eukprot:Sro2290_g322170.1 n/a (303) ;mRNA; f:5138-6241